ncbi:zinc ribbon domain-containing protein [Mycolicibacterium celeriflavum]|uniref:zinc ribbon domain-containing protein n=1 Tax=Mycolicibacterium celeriflavum TaxID=1249101 RepID=UPI0013F4CB3A|nr:zinc ribbon domain-containing protein [Mycolicibacterium celeriflavum]
MSKTHSGNALGLGLVVVGAAALAISVFLPLTERTGVFSMVQNNSLIQHGGWILLLFAIGIAASGVGASQGRSYQWIWCLVGCIIAGAILIYTGSDENTRTLYPVGPDGAADITQPGIVAPLGIAIYVAGAGVVAAAAGALTLAGFGSDLGGDDEELVRRWAEEDSPTKKKCPDCAERVLYDARVCKHCGYRFGDAIPKLEPKPPPPDPQAAERAVRCHNCSHVQQEAFNVTLTSCDNCGATMKLPRGKREAAPAPTVQKRFVRCSICDAEQAIRATAQRFTCGKCGETMTAPPA